MRNALAVLCLALAGCLAPVPDHEVLPPSDAGLPDAGAWVCGPGTCAGCCEKNRCRSGTLESACGNHGAACAACGVDALCGPSNSCELLDPARYGMPENLNATVPPETSHVTCIYVNGAQVCW